MKRTAEQIKAELLAQAEQAIDELLSWSRDSTNPPPTFAQIEDMVLKVRNQLSAQMAATILQEQQEAIQTVPGPPCPVCGREMHYKGSKPNAIQSKVGAVKVQRSHYYCPDCQQGLFPPG